jgi:UDP-GlcNAc:undecaprenyl-phosphate GlcNAc-1-phosphate transferase
MQDYKTYFLFLIFNFFSFIVIYYISNKFELHDIPTKRKRHKNKTVNTGGIILFISILFLIKKYEINIVFETLILNSFFYLLIGFVDDKVNLKPSIKFISLIIPLLLLTKYNFFLNSLGTINIFGMVLNLSLGKLSFIFTIIAILVLINAINYIDGIDGLAISTSIIILFFCAFVTSNLYLEKFILHIIVVLFLLLIFNLSSKFKIFIGNCGSLLLGYIISIILIILAFEENIKPIMIAWLIWYPVYDFLNVGIIRFKKKLYIHLPSKDHLHDTLRNKFKLKDWEITFVISILNIAVILCGVAISKVNVSLAFSIFIVFFFVYFFINFFLNKKR